MKLASRCPGVMDSSSGSERTKMPSPQEALQVPAQHPPPHGYLLSLAASDREIHNTKRGEELHWESFECKIRGFPIREKFLWLKKKKRIG